MAGSTHSRSPDTHASSQKRSDSGRTSEENQSVLYCYGMTITWIAVETRSDWQLPKDGKISEADYKTLRDACLPTLSHSTHKENVKLFASSHGTIK